MKVTRVGVDMDQLASRGAEILAYLEGSSIFPAGEGQEDHFQRSVTMLAMMVLGIKSHAMQVGYARGVMSDTELQNIVNAFTQTCETEFVAAFRAGQEEFASSETQNVLDKIRSQ